MSVAFVLLFLAIPCWAIPVASVPDATFTFEAVPDGDSVIHEFVIQNTGDTELKIENVVPG